MPGWLNNLITSPGFSLVVGAFLATLGGFIATLIHESRQRTAVRQGLATILHGELLADTPRDDPVNRDPDQAIRLKISAVSPLLAPGIVDPSKNQHLLMDLILLSWAVDEFNERAALYDQAFAAGANERKMQILYNSLQLSNWNYREIHRNVLTQLWQLGPPLTSTDQLYELTRWQKFQREWDLRRNRKARQAWADHKHEVERREGSPERVYPQGDLISHPIVLMSAFVLTLGFVLVLVLLTAVLYKN